MAGKRVITKLAAAGVLALCGPALLVACSDDSKSSDSAQGSSSDSSSTTAGGAVNQGAVIEVSEFSYSPANQTVKVGETITFTNVGSAVHTVTPDVEPGQPEPFPSDQVPPNPDSPYVVTINTPGTYEYYCSIHGRNTMSGTITVEPAA